MSIAESKDLRPDGRCNRAGRGMDRQVGILGAVTSILVGAGTFVVIALFASFYLLVIEWAMGPVDDRRFVLAGGLVLGFLFALKGLDRFTRWCDRGS